MRSASWRFCRLRHLPSDPSTSLTTTSACPASLRSATTFDPMNPAPPVTRNMGCSFSAMKLMWRFLHHSETSRNIEDMIQGLEIGEKRTPGAVDKLCLRFGQDVGHGCNDM